MPIVTRVPDNFGPRYEVPGKSLPGILRCTQLLQVEFAAMATGCGRSGSGPEMQLDAAVAGRGRSWTRPQLGAVAAGRG